MKPGSSSRRPGRVRGAARALRYGWSFARGTTGVEELEIEIAGKNGGIPATVFRPSRARASLPGWVVLHGITVPGRAHPTLRRFVRAVASSGAVVLVPEIEAWMRLRLDPDHSVPIIMAAVRALAGRHDVAPGHAGLIGFSFGAPQALAAAADPSLKGQLGAVVAFGGYCDLERTVRFLFTGRHEWKGVERTLRPDPYGRWVLASNYLERARGFEGAGDVARALHELAVEAGKRRVPSWNPIHNPLKERLGATLSSGDRPLFRLLTRGDAGLDPVASEPLVLALTEAASEISARYDPRNFIERIQVPVRLVHGAHDHLIPYTETLRMREAFGDRDDVHATVTGLFGHSEVGERSGRLQAARENASLLAELGRIFRLI